MISTKLLGVACVIAGLAETASAAKPLFVQKDIFIAGLDGVCQYRIPAIVTTNKGTLVAVCDARVDRPGDAPNNIDQVVKRSLDRGKTWTRMKVIVDFPGNEAAGDPTLLVDRKTGTIWMFYAYAIPKPDVKPFGRVLWVHAVTSDDDGVSWSKPIDVTAAFKKPEWSAIVTAPGMGIQTRAGRLLVPCYSRTGDRWSSHLSYSDDHGKTWHIGGPAPLKTNECQVVELVDGTLMLNMRSKRGKGCRAVATSTDGGKTWSEAIDATTLVEPVCQGSFIRYTDRRDGYAKDRVLFANPASRKRENMTVRLSYDEGKTWPIAKVLHTGPAAYSCPTILADGTIAVFYERGDQSAYETITFARFNLEWLTDGKDCLRRERSCKRAAQ